MVEVVDTTTAQPSRAHPPDGEQVLALKCVVGQTQGVHYRLAPGLNVIGRCEDADIRLLDSGVSRNHVEVVLAPGREVTINDLGSTNGTFVEGDRIESATLSPGGTVGVGAGVVLQLVYQFRDAQAARLERLSKREREVAMMVARAMSNEAIATALGVKRRTVETHLERVYAKTGFKSRVELSTYVIAHHG